MTPELKAKWLADLRSGKYPKTRLRLKDHMGYCCLGVLCETAGVGFKGRIAGEKISYDARCDKGQQVSHGNDLSPYGRSKFGLTEYEHDRLVEINDSSYTFAQVIDWIERFL